MTRYECQAAQTERRLRFAMLLLTAMLPLLRASAQVASLPFVEDFDAYQATESWLPSRAVEGWTVHLEGDARTALGPAYGRSGNGMALFRPADAWNRMAWHPRMGVTPRANTVRAWVRASAGGFCDMATVSRDGRALTRVTLAPGEGIRRFQLVPETLLSPAEFKGHDWHRVDIQHDFDAGRYRVRIGDRDWHGWTPFLRRAHADGAGRVGFATTTTTGAAPGCCVDDVTVLSLPGAASREPWVLHFEDVFDRDELGGNWAVLDGTFRPVYDVPNGIGKLNGSGALVLLRRLPGDVRVEIEAESRDPGDLSLMLATNERGYAGGYFLGFGSNGNTMSKLLRLGKKVAVAGDAIQPAKRHRVVGERRGSVVTLRVDGKEVLRYDDPKPLAGPAHGLVGLYLFKPGSVHRVRVYGRKGEEPAKLEALPVTETERAESDAEPEPEVNLAGNPSFETVLPGIWPRLASNWVAEYAAVGDRPKLIRDPARAHRGDRFVRLDPRGPWMKLHNIGTRGSGVPLKEGMTYAFSAWMRGPRTHGTVVEFHIGGTRFDVGAEWQEYTTSFDVPKGQNASGRGFFIKAFGPVDIDDVTIVQRGNVPPAAPELAADRTQLQRADRRPDWLKPPGGPAFCERIELEVSEVVGSASGPVRLRVPVAELFGALPAYDFVAPDKLDCVDAGTGVSVPFALLEADLRVGVTRGDVFLFAASVPASARKTYYVYLRDRDPVEGPVFAGTEAELPETLRNRPDPAYAMPLETVGIERLGTLRMGRRADGGIACELTAPAGWHVKGTLSSPEGEQRQAAIGHAGPGPRWTGVTSLSSAAITPGVWGLSVAMTDEAGATRTATAGLVVGAAMWAGGNLIAIASDDPPLPGRRKASLVTARGERESFQVAVAAEDGLAGVELVAGDLVHSSGADPIPAGAWQLERVEEVFVGITAPSPVLRHVDGRFVNAGNYPDPLLPWSSVDIPAGRQRVCLATLHVPQTAAAGMYTGTIAATARDGTRLALPVEVRVHDFAMPQHSSFTMLISGMVGYVSVPEDRDGSFGRDVRYYHLWDIEAQDELAAFVASKGMTPALTGTPYGASATPWTYDADTQTAHIDFLRFDRTAQVLLDHHGIDFIGIAWSSGWHRPGRAHTYVPLDAWPARDVGWGTGYKNFPLRANVDTEKGLQMTSAYARALATHLEERGWLDRVSFYIFDEPKSQAVNDTILGVARTIRAAHPRLRMWGAGYGKTWQPYFDDLHLFTGTISNAVRERLRERGTRYLGRYNQPIDILAVARAVALHGWCEGWDGYYHHETTTNGDSWIHPEPPRWSNRYVPKYVNGTPSHWMMLSGFIYHWPVDELGEPLPEGRTRAWASSLRLEALRESSEDAHVLNMLRDAAADPAAGPALKARVAQITTKLEAFLERGRIPYSHEWYYNYRLDEVELAGLRREIYAAGEQAVQRR